MSEYVELHCHSAFSFLDGASLPDELLAAAAEQGHAALALTDHNTLSGSMEHAQAARALGVRAIHGAEIDVVDGASALGAPLPRHITLLVQDARGWRNLCRLITRAWAHTRAHTGLAPPHGLSAGEPAVTLDDVEAHAEGLVCLSGCARQGVRDEPTMRRLLSAFGRERFRVELQRPFLRCDRALNRGLAGLAARLGVPCVATGNVHAHSRARGPLQDALVAVRLHATLDASEPARRGNHSHALAPPAAMAARFADHPGAAAESARLAERLRFDLLEDLGYRYPYGEDPTAERRLAELCRARLAERYPAGARGSGHEARLEEELRVIRALGLSGFFLLHHEILELAREVAAEVRGRGAARSMLPPGRGRGSSVSSLVCHLTGLSHVDPLERNLGLGRFLHEDLKALPDIDLDFPRDVREALIPRIHERYGRERSALVAAFPTYRARGAIRDFGKALGLPPGEIERVARSSDGWDARGVARDAALALGERRAGSGRWAWLGRLAAEAHRLPRHISQHSGGMIVSTRPLVDCCPVVPAAMRDRQIAQWDKDSCADAGFLKIDLLGLGMLSVVERAVDLIARTRGERIDLSRIPYDDEQVYGTIQRAETTGVFQIESRAQMQSLRRTRPASLADLTIQVAIVRPGPIQGGAVNPYVHRRQCLLEDPSYEIPYPHPSLEEPLAETLGTIIFQDQVIDVARAFAGFSAGDAESLRRAMSRKRSDEAVEAHHRRFVEGAIARHGVAAELAERVWGMIRGFSGFGFPKAHGAAFALLAYQSTWLKVHYAPELLCALVDEQPMGFYPPDALVHDAQRAGIEVLRPDVERSELECAVEHAGGGVREDGSITAPLAAASRPVSEGGEVGPVARVRLGLNQVIGVRREEVAALIDARRERPFASLADLAARAGAGRPALERLAWAGACDGLAGGDRRVALWQLGVATPARRVRGGGAQLALGLDLPRAPELRPIGDWEAMIADYRTSGLTTAAHPLALLRPALPAEIVTSAALGGLEHGARVRVAGLVVARQRPETSSGVVFMLLEDERGTINLVIPPPVYERHRLAVRAEPLLVADGRLERFARGGGTMNVVVRSLRAVEAPAAVAREDGDGAEREADVRPLPRRERAAAGAAAGAESDFRAVAPPAMSWAQGRRR